MQWIKKHKIKLSILLILSIWYYNCLPDSLFNVSYSTVIESSDGELLDAHIALDEQWRFPPADSIPYKYEQALLHYEDEHFYDHPGFNPVSISKALVANIKAGKTVRGASTLSQQVIRLSRKRNRNYYEKFIELIWSTRMELQYSKTEILNLYAAHAPYGGNVVGLEMAAWRYYGRKPHELSWAESAMLAVLPNAPSLIFPGKRNDALRDKRDALLLKLLDKEIIDSLDYDLAIAEDIPVNDFKVPQKAPHLLQRIRKTDAGKRLTTSINRAMQEKAAATVARFHKQYKTNGVHNMALLILDIKSQQVIAYIANAPTTAQHGKDVDIITAPRSTGSVLKPFLYAAMLDAGELLPHSLVADVPTTIDGYTTQNYDLKYTGAVPASTALSRSLNIPAVRMLQEYTVPRFYNKLTILGLNDINKGSDHYGLSLIIGGAESSMWDISNAYLSLAVNLDEYTTNSSRYSYDVIDNLSWHNAYNERSKTLEDLPQIYGAGSIYQMFEAMKQVNRPQEEQLWYYLNPNKEIAWKTGTSYGNRDAWAVGITPDYVISVWTGNADGEGRAGMTGIEYAAPVVFDIFNNLPARPWFNKPYDDLVEVSTCKQSGFLASPICPNLKIETSPAGVNYKSCPYHVEVATTLDEKYRVNTDCEITGNIKTTTYFELPPAMAWYYRKNTSNYKPLPPLRLDCGSSSDEVMSFIKPNNNTVIIPTLDRNGQVNKTIVELAHKRANKKVFWYLNESFLETTSNFHEIALTAPKGKHSITAVDEDGNTARLKIIFK